MPVPAQSDASSARPIIAPVKEFDEVRSFSRIAALDPVGPVVGADLTKWPFECDQAAEPDALCLYREFDKKCPWSLGVGVAGGRAQRCPGSLACLPGHRCVSRDIKFDREIPTRGLIAHVFSITISVDSHSSS